MSNNGAITVKTIPWNNKLPSFKLQFTAFIQQSGHFQGLRYKLRPGVTIADFHDQDGVAKAKPSHDDLDPTALTDDEQKSQIFVRTQLLLASDDPVWLSIFRKIPQASKYCGTDSYVAVLNRYAPASAGQRSKLRQTITNMSHVPPELAINFIIRMETLNEELKALDDPGFTDGALADMILTKLHDVYKDLRNQIYARADPEDLEAIRHVFVQQGPRFDAEIEALKTPTTGAAFASVTPTPAAPDTRRQLICWACGGPHGKRDSREKGWAPCIEYCKNIGKTFKPPNSNRPNTGVAAIATAADTSTYDNPPARATGLQLTAYTTQATYDLPDDAWAIDCAASFTVTGYMNEMPKNHIPDNARIYGLGHINDNYSSSTALGQINLNFLDKNKLIINTGNFCVRHVPDLAHSPVKRLLSVSETMRLRGWRFIFNGTDDSVVIINDKTIPLGYAPGCGLFYLRPTAVGTVMFSYTKATPDKNLWHLRLGHLGISLMDKTMRSTSSTGMSFPTGDTDHFCEVCATTKARAEALNRALTDISGLKCMERLQWDLWGPLPVVAYGNTRFVSSMVDMASGACILVNVPGKDDAYENHLKLAIATANRYGHTIKTIRSDNDRSLVDNNTSRQIMMDNKITAELTGRDNHHRIGATERRWQTLHSMAAAMLHHAGLGLEFMGYAIAAANHILNRVWSDSKKCVPYAKLANIQTIDLSYLRVFGCPCYVHIDPQDRKKFENQTVKGIFIGYYNTDGDYIIWNPETKRALHSRSVQFHENWKAIGDPTAPLSTGLHHWTPARRLQRDEATPLVRARDFTVDSVIKRITDDDLIASASPLPGTTAATATTTTTATVAATTTATPPSTTPPAPTVTPSTPLAAEDHATTDEHVQKVYDSTDDDDVDCPTDNSTVDATDDIQPASPEFRRSSRTTVRHNYNSVNSRGFTFTALGAHRGLGPVPKSLAQAYRSPEREDWRAARNAEQSSLHDKQVLAGPMPLPAGKHAIPLHYVFDRKYHRDGAVKKHKIRAVVNGSKQIYGIDYTETFAPCTRFATFRLFFAIVAGLALTTASFDVKTAYLNAELEEEIYVRPLPVFPDETSGVPDGQVFRLQRALYGLRQAGREWFLKFSSTMKELGFTQSLADPGIYIKLKDGTIDIILLVYVDDIIAAGHGDSWISVLRQQLEEHFEITYDGEADWCLGMGIDHNSDGSVKIHQTKYIDDMLSNFNLTEANAVTTPMLPGYDDTAASPPISDDTPYASLVGSLNYAAVCTRPDISYAVSILSKHLKNPTQNHWQAAKRVLRYLKGTKDYGLTYCKQDTLNNTLIGYCDASYASTSDAKSISGNCFLFNMAAVLWTAATQKAVSTSTAEAEYYSLGTAGQDAVFLRELLATMNLQQHESTVIYEDNTACLAIANNPITSKKARHIKVKYHYIRQLIEDKEVTAKYKPTDDMLADIFTKALDSDKHQKFTRQIMNIKN